MRTITIFSALAMFAFVMPMMCMGISNGDFCSGNNGDWSEFTGASSSVSYFTVPPCYVQIHADANEVATIWQQETGFDSGETWRATFDIKSVSGSGLITIGWTNISGDFYTGYQEITGSGTVNIDCNDFTYPFVSIQGDGSSLLFARVEVNSVSTAEVVAPTPTPTVTPMTLPGQYTFNSSVDGWGFLSLSGSGFSHV